MKIFFITIILVTNATMINSRFKQRVSGNELKPSQSKTQNPELQQIDVEKENGGKISVIGKSFRALENQQVIFGHPRQRRSLGQEIKSIEEQFRTVNVKKIRKQNKRKVLKKNPFRTLQDSQNKLKDKSISKENLKKENCQCGLAKPGINDKRHQAYKTFEKQKNRIVNGYIPNSRPWQVFLMVSNGNCGGSIINHLFILTAAHCFCADFKGKLCIKEQISIVDVPNLSKLVTATIGGLNIADTGLFQTGAEEIFQHPERVKLEISHRAKSDRKNFDPYAGPFDITLVKVNTFIAFNEKVRPICLFPNNDLYSFDLANVAGYGSTTFGSVCWTDLDSPNPFQKCMTSYTVEGKSYSEESCVTEVDPPDFSAACNIVTEKLGKYPESYNQVILNLPNGKTAACTKKGRGKYGWCLVEKSYNNETEKRGVLWGYCSPHCSEQANKASTKLMEAQLSILPKEKCVNLGDDVVIESEFCAAKENKEYISVGIAFPGNMSTSQTRLMTFYGGADACQGDSGGPLWVWIDKSPRDIYESVAYQVGLVSRGNGCAYRNKPGVYTLLQQYKSYITNIASSGGCL